MGRCAFRHTRSVCHSPPQSGSSPLCQPLVQPLQDGLGLRVVAPTKQVGVVQDVVQPGVTKAGMHPPEVGWLIGSRRCVCSTLFEAEQQSERQQVPLARAKGTNQLGSQAPRFPACGHRVAHHS